MSEAAFLPNLAGALVSALIGGLAARALRLPVLVGYIAAGIAVGPYTPGFIADQHAVDSVARLGVALLMFAVGVQLHLEELREVRRIALLGGMLQILGTTGLGLLLGAGLGWGLYAGFFLGCALSLSSTAVMMRVLEERGELGSAHGRAMLGILVVQDLSLLVMVLLLPSLKTVAGEGPQALLGMAASLVRALALVSVTLLLALRGVPRALDRVARVGSPELFLMAVVCICLGAAFLASLVGLSVEVGAFLAGLVISESDYAHEAFTQVRPLRDVFAALFFVSIGMLLDPAFLLSHWAPVLAVVATILIGKSLVTALAVYASGGHGRTAILAGAGLAQIGEFSLVLATVGIAGQLIRPEIAGVLLAAALVTILLTPLTYSGGAALSRRLDRLPTVAAVLHRGLPSDPPALPEPAGPAAATRDRALVLGCGRIGGYICDALRAADIEQVVVDYDPQAVARLRSDRIPAIYGDATSDVVLGHALGLLGAGRAAGSPEGAPGLVAIVALPEAGITEMAVRQLKRLAPAVPVVARAHRSAQMESVRAAGADVVIEPEFEAAAETLNQVARYLTTSRREIEGFVESLRAERELRPDSG